nr:hypothetical protein CFP56_50947 [Quercus suber]
MAMYPAGVVDEINCNDRSESKHGITSVEGDDITGSWTRAVIRELGNIWAGRERGAGAGACRSSTHPRLLLTMLVYGYVEWFTARYSPSHPNIISKVPSQSRLLYCMCLGVGCGPVVNWDWNGRNVHALAAWAAKPIMRLAPKNFSSVLTGTRQTRRAPGQCKVFPVQVSSKQYLPEGPGLKANESRFQGRLKHRPGKTYRWNMYLSDTRQYRGRDAEWRRSGFARGDEEDWKKQQQRMREDCVDGQF